MTAFILGVSPRDTGAFIIFLLPESRASGDGTDQPVIPFWIQVKGAPIPGQRVNGAEETLAFTCGGRAAKLEPVPFFFFTLINNLVTGHTEIATVFIQV